MANDSLGSSLPGQAKCRPLGFLSTDVVDAINDIDHLLSAYRCVETLLMPVAHHEARQLEMDHQELHALMSVLNDTLASRIRRAKRLTHRVTKQAKRSG